MQTLMNPLIREKKTEFLVKNKRTEINILPRKLFWLPEITFVRAPKVEIENLRAMQRKP